MLKRNGKLYFPCPFKVQLLENQKSKTKKKHENKTSDINIHRSILLSNKHNTMFQAMKNKRNKASGFIKIFLYLSWTSEYTKHMCMTKLSKSLSLLVENSSKTCLFHAVSVLLSIVPRPASFTGSESVSIPFSGCFCSMATTPRL